MKKSLFILASILILSLSISACGSNNKDTEDITPPVTDIQSEDKPSEDPRDEQDATRNEIAQKFADIEELIELGMIDDAKKMVENLKTFDLNDQEKDKFMELQARLVVLSAQ